MPPTRSTAVTPGMIDPTAPIMDAMTDLAGRSSLETPTTRQHRRSRRTRQIQWPVEPDALIEILPKLASRMIRGNNWLNRAKAKIDFNSSTLKVAYKDQKAELPITFLRKKERVPKMVTYTQNYQNPISLTNSSPKRVHFEDEATEDTEETHSEELSNSEETSDEDYSAEDEASDDEAVV
ncbi:hypothetical protein G6F33_013306 [Rhizopus arrhizus]|nr:hypothetical protein G6F33_013306 [Rhizopus arrhizus]